MFKLAAGLAEYKRMKTLSILFILFSFNCSFAQYCTSDVQAATECCVLVKSVHQTNIQRIPSADNVTCSLDVVSSNHDVSFRRFGFSSDGQFSIFMQPGGDRAHANATQSFLLFPFGEIPMAKEQESKINIKSGSGQKWVFNALTGLPESLEGCELTVNPHFSMSDSGIRISSCEHHLVIETPIEAFGEYMEYPAKPLVVHDPAGGVCHILNSDIYRYNLEHATASDKAKGRFFDVKLKFKTNHELGQHLKAKCPNLDVSMLMN